MTYDDEIFSRGEVNSIQYMLTQVPQSSNGWPTIMKPYTGTIKTLTDYT
jgi:hypothetical protein